MMCINITRCQFYVTLTGSCFATTGGELIIILRFDSILEYHVLMRTLINALNPGDIVALIFFQFFTIIEYHVLVRALMSCRYLRSCDERWFDTVG